MPNQVIKSTDKLDTTQYTVGNRVIKSIQVQSPNEHLMTRSGESPFIPHEDSKTVTIQKSPPQYDQLDVEFLPVSRSLKGNGLVREEWMDIKWQDLASTLPGSTLFKGPPHPDEIVQGNLSDAYFLAAISALA